MKIKSNIKSFNKAFKSYANDFSSKLDLAIEYLCDKVYKKLNDNINKANLYSVHTDNYSFTNDIKKVKMNNRKWAIKLGENSLREAKDGNLVNPFMYFEFGFGFTGEMTEAKIQEEANRYGWKYDINKHGNDGWTYPLTHSTPTKITTYTIWTNGIEGQGFILDTINWFYRYQKTLIKSAFKKAGLII